MIVMRLYKSKNGLIHILTKDRYLVCNKAIGKVRCTVNTNNRRFGYWIGHKYCLNCLTRNDFKK